jgi:hypothetical protein
MGRREQAGGVTGAWCAALSTPRDRRASCGGRATTDVKISLARSSLERLVRRRWVWMNDRHLYCEQYNYQVDRNNLCVLGAASVAAL